MDDIIGRLGRYESFLDEASGVSIRYIHDPKHESSGHVLSARANAAAGSTTFLALTYKGERYDFKTQKVWSSVAPNFGIPFGSKVLTVEIGIPDKLAIPSQYRDSLLRRHDRSPLTADQYAYLVRELMPDWVKDIIRSESPDGSDDLDDLQADLQRLLDELRVPTSVIRRDTSGELLTDRNSIGVADTERTIIEAEDEEDSQPDRNSTRKTLLTRASKKRLRSAPEGAIPSRTAHALERAPEIKILTEQAEIEERGLKGRAAKFYEEVETIFVNGLYSSVNRMADELFNEMVGGEPDEMRSLSLQAARRSIAFRVGKVTCYALAKRQFDDWSREDRETATSPESLSMAADDYRHSLPAARRWIKERVRIASVPALGVQSEI
ncbi:hypothetical protein [Methylobacterium komagatae]